MGLDRNFTQSFVVADVQNTTKEMNFLTYFRLYIDYPSLNNCRSFPAQGKPRHEKIGGMHPWMSNSTAIQGNV
jgi:hypothetical protein